MEIKLFDFSHPVHGPYSVWFNPELRSYGITKSDRPVWCAYASLASLFAAKGL